MIRNNIYIFITHIVISIGVLSGFSLIDATAIFGNGPNTLTPYILLLIALSAIYMTIGFSLLKMEGKPIFLNVIGLSSVLMILAVITLVWTVYFDGEGSLGYFMVAYYYMNPAYAFLLEWGNLMLIISAILPSFFIWVGILLKTMYNKQKIVNTKEI